MNKRISLKRMSVFSMSLLLAGMSAVMPASALTIIARGQVINATTSRMSAQDVCTSTGMVSTDPADNVTWKCSSANLDTTTAGLYQINIRATDHSTGDTSNTSVNVRVKSVKRNTPPTLSLTTGSVTIAKGQGINLRSYIASASDAEDGNIAGRVKISGSVNTHKAGSYKVTYSVSDNAGATATLSLTVNVVENASQATNSVSSGPVSAVGTGGTDGGDSTVTASGTSYASATGELPNTSDASTLTLGGIAALSIGGIALLSRKKREITE